LTLSIATYLIQMTKSEWMYLILITILALCFIFLFCIIIVAKGTNHIIGL